MVHLGPGETEIDDGWHAQLALLTCPVALDTHAKSFGIKLRCQKIPQVWTETSSLEKTLQSSQSWDWYLLCLFALLFLDQKNTAKSRAGEEPLKADLQLTGMITQNHSCSPKMLNAGFFVLLCLAYAAVTSFYIPSWHGASAPSLFFFTWLHSLYTHHNPQGWTHLKQMGKRIQETLALYQTT